MILHDGIGREIWVRSVDYIRPPFPGEYHDNVKSVINGNIAVRETMAEIIKHITTHAAVA